MPEPVTETFTTASDWSVPDDAAEVTLECHGGKGEDGSNDGFGGSGGLARARLVTRETDIDTLHVRFTAGGAGDAAQIGGEGADIRLGGTSLHDRILVAGGGGGGAGSSSISGGNRLEGGDGGADVGEDGDGATSGSTGFGGTQTEGGDVGGELGFGGDGQELSSWNTGGGGGGLYGGGGGSEGTTDNGDAGGGGSNGYDLGVVDELLANERGSADTSSPSGMVVIEYVPTPAGPTNLTAATGTDGVDLAWTDNAAGYDGTYELRVYRDTEPGVSPDDTLVEALPEGTESYTDTTAEEGVSYNYRVYAFNVDAGHSEPSNEVAVARRLPAPTDLSVVDVGDGTVTLSFVTRSTSEGGYRVWVREDADGAWSQQHEFTDDALAGETVEVEVPDLLHGQLYGLTVSVFSDGDEVWEVERVIDAGSTLEEPLTLITTTEVR